MSEALAIREKPSLDVGLERQRLAGFKRLDDAIDLRAKAAAVQSFLGKRTEEALNAAEVKLRAERRIGELLEPGKEKRGGPKSPRTTLPDGITRDQSAKWQDVARVPEESFEGYIAERRAIGGTITTAGVLRLLPVEAEAAQGAADGESNAESCETEEGACGPVTPRDRMLHIALLMKGFNKIRDYDPGPLAQLGTKKSLKELSVQIDGVIKWLDSFKATINRRL